MREAENALQQFAEYVLKHSLARQTAVPYVVRWVRQFLARAAGIYKPVSAHTLRHAFATHLLLNGVDIREIQEYLSHAHVETTMICTHVVKDLRTAPRSPLDRLLEEHHAPQSTRLRAGSSP